MAVISLFASDAAARHPGPLASARGLVKRYGDVPALDGVSLEIPAGQIVGMLGPNGAGKSTLISLLSGLLTPTGGEATLFGGDPRKPASRVRLGVTPQDTSFPAQLRVEEVVAQVAAHYPDPLPPADVIAKFGLTDVARRLTSKLSGGQRRRLTVALAMVGRPAMVFLDEPTTGLDAGTRSILWETLREYNAGGGTILLTSHYLEEIEALAERVVVIDRGRVVVDDELRAVVSRVQVKHVTAVMAPSDAAALAESVGGSLASEVPDGGQPVRFFAPDADLLVRQLVASGVPFTDLTIRGATLEEAVASLDTERRAA